MKCKNCNYDIPDGAKFCPICGGKQDFTESYGSPAPPPPLMYGCPPQYESVKDSPKYVGFGGAIALYFKNFVNFRGRSTRSEYWFAFLFVSLIKLCSWLVGIVIPGIFLIVDLVFFIPSLAIVYRRFHDTGRTGTLPLIRVIIDFAWKIITSTVLILLLTEAFGITRFDLNLDILFLLLNVLFCLEVVPFGLYIWQIAVCCFDSKHEPNKYGREPRY